MQIPVSTICMSVQYLSCCWLFIEILALKWLGPVIHVTFYMFVISLDPVSIQQSLQDE